MQLYQGDCLEVMKQIPDDSIDLVLTDPPYNIRVNTKRRGKRAVNPWDVIPNYIDWCIAWLKECQRVLKPNGVLYFWHNDMMQITQLLHEMQKQTTFALQSFCIWDKGDAYRPFVWVNRDPEGKTALRSWFTVCEYCLHFFNTSGNTASRSTLQRSCQNQRPVHHCDAKHCNIWHIPPIPTARRYHTCQKPVELLERLIRVSSDEGATVLDCFMGSGSTGVACVNTHRAFIGIERDEQYFAVAQRRLEAAWAAAG